MVSGSAGPISKIDKRLPGSIRLTSDGNNKVCWVRDIGIATGWKLTPEVPETTLFNSLIFFSSFR
jgi:hypothetical protein